MTRSTFVTPDCVFFYIVVHSSFYVCFSAMIEPVNMARCGSARDDLRPGEEFLSENNRSTRLRDSSYSISETNSFTVKPLYNIPVNNNLSRLL
jgi:hypothetical protein